MRTFSEETEKRRSNPTCGCWDRSTGGLLSPPLDELPVFEWKNLPCKVQRQPWCEVKDRGYITASSAKTYKEFNSLYATELVSNRNLIIRFSFISFLSFHFLFIFFRSFFLFFPPSCWMCCPHSSVSLLRSLVSFLPRIMWCWTEPCTLGQTPEF